MANEQRLIPEKTNGHRGIGNATYHDLTKGTTYKVPNDGRVLLHLKGGDRALKVDLTARATLSGIPLVQPSIDVPARGDAFAGPLDPRIFNDPSGDIAFSVGADGVKVAVLRFSDR